MGQTLISLLLAGLNNVVSVSAIGPGDNFNCWATAGTTVDLCAPGESVLTTSLNGSYGSYNGTSFSSPIVAGALSTSVVSIS